MLLEEQGPDSGEFGAALTEALAAAADEGFAVLESIERLSASLDLDEDFATLTLTCEFAASNSVFSRSLTVAAEAVSPPPDRFWQLPVEATDVTWVSWPQTPIHEALRTHAGPALEGLLKLWGAKPASLKVASRAAGPLVDSTPLVGAASRGGVDPAASTPGWSAYNVTREKAKVEAELDAWMTILKDPAVRELDEHWAFASRKRAHWAQGLGAPAVRYDLKVTTNVAELLTKIPQPDAAGVGAPVPVVLLVHPSAEGTWLVFAGDGRTAEAQLRRVTSGDGRTLAQEEALAALRHRNANGGGAMSIAGILGELQAAGIVPDQLPQAALADLNAGRVWLPYTYAAGQRADKVVLTGSVILPSAVFKAAGGVALPSILELMKQ
jgi:hypothetical protein